MELPEELRKDTVMDVDPALIPVTVMEEVPALQSVPLNVAEQTFPFPMLNAN